MIILADNNLRGAVHALRLVIEHEWGKEALGLDLKFMSLEDLGLGPRSSDAEIYAKCLEIDAILVTSDKTTGDGAESLEYAIRHSGREDSAPVITIANQVRVLKDAAYQSECAFNLIDCLSNIDNYRGVGRVFLPF